MLAELPWERIARADRVGLGCGHHAARSDDSVVDIIRGMPNVLIRDVPPDDLGQLRAMAAERGTSLQTYLRGVLHAQAVYLRRQAAIVHISERLRGLPEVPDGERRAVLAAVDRVHDERAEQLSGRPAS